MCFAMCQPSFISQRQRPDVCLASVRELLCFKMPARLSSFQNIYKGNNEDKYEGN